jgi:hypothetical protein
MDPVTRCPYCKSVLDDATHTIQTRHDRRGLLLSCCSAWMSELSLLDSGILIQWEAREHDVVVIGHHEQTCS